MQGAVIGASHAAGGRFGFGRNWARFLEQVDEGRIAHAEAGLTTMLGPALTGLRFLDVGCGSGLSSLAARRLGARVHGFDYDPDSVACAEALRGRYRPDDPDWTIERGSILDERYVERLGRFDVVYAWGVLHHTGALWQACDHAGALVAPGGRLLVAVYNDQGGASRRWTAVKRLYNRLPRALRAPLVALGLVWTWGPTTLYDLLKGQPFGTWRTYRRRRGMAPWRDLIDWVGGYPFEVAKPEQVFDFFRARGFVLSRMRTCGGGRGCNEFVFERMGEAGR